MTAIKKTGGWVYLSEYGKYVYGDIYQSCTGAIWVRVVEGVEGNYTHTRPRADGIWATISHVEGEYPDGATRTIIGTGVMHWYWGGDGKPEQLPTGTPIADI